MKARILSSVALAALLAGACVVSSGKSRSTGSGGDGGSGQGGMGGGFDPVGTGGEGGITDVPCDNPDGMDGDGDGWAVPIDCNDCTALMNPGAYDYAGNQIDEDCNGSADDTVGGCDGALDITSTDPMDGARAMGLCQAATGDAWGVTGAEYIHVDGSPGGEPTFHDGHGILTHFGALVNPQEGTQLFAVSSGSARNPGDPGYQPVDGYDKGYTSNAAPGFPKESPACPGVITGQAHDSIALRVKIKTPTNAKSLAFNVNMYTVEFPVFICSQYNDFVTAIMAPAPPGQGDATCGGVQCGNISFDTQGNPLSVNAGFLEVCTPQMAGGKNFPCNLGPDQLNGTGFESHAATGWLQTTAPLPDPGAEITIEFGAWDSGDGVLDTTGLFDNFSFEFEDTPTQTAPVPTPE
jgi:hypothetical protein